MVPSVRSIGSVGERQQPPPALPPLGSVSALPLPLFSAPASVTPLFF